MSLVPGAVAVDPETGALAPHPRRATLGALFDAVAPGFAPGFALGPDVAGTTVTGLNLDSRFVRPGELYLALPGRGEHGLSPPPHAVRLGSVSPPTVPGALDAHPDVRDALRAARTADGEPVVAFEVGPDAGGLAALAGPLAAAFFDAPDRAMRLVAVTGTDGKTSVCRFVAAALAALGTPAGYVGTIGWGPVRAPTDALAAASATAFAEGLAPSALTTPDAITLVRMLAALRDAGVEAVALEASSHGIAEGRLDGLELDVAVLTNLGRDHLDYHGTVEAYGAAKARLFDVASLSRAVLNAGDAFGRGIAATLRVAAGPDGTGAAVPGVIDFDATGAAVGEAAGEAAGDAAGPAARAAVVATDIVADPDGLGFTLVEGAVRVPVRSPLLGRFNVDNLLACHAVLRALGHGAVEAAESLGALRPVPGRMERVAGAGAASAVPGPTAIVDFAHTPGALEAAIAAARAHCPGRLHVVFGCGGDRDPGKRAPMARAAEVADVVLVTDDNPRTEDPARIVADIVAGFARPDRVRTVHDRRAAIELAVTGAGDDDVVLIAGKGHEDYQIVGTERHAFSDREAVAAALAARMAARAAARDAAPASAARPAPSATGAAA